MVIHDLADSADVAAHVANGVYGPYSAPLTTTSSQASNTSTMYLDQNMQYAQYLVPPQYPTITTPQYIEGDSPISQSGPISPGKLDVQRLTGHARAVSLPASVGMQSPELQQNGEYPLD
jgi:hypothetical protein